MSKTQITPTLEWDEVFDCAVAAWCRSSTSQEMLKMCFQSRTQRNEVSVGWTANELMAFATGIARLVASPTPPAEQQAQQEAQEPVMIYHGRCTIDCGEHGHHDMEMLRMIPAGSKLYTDPQPAPLSDDVSQKTWALLDELEKLRGADRYDEDWVTLNKRDSELRTALGAQGDTP